MDGEGYSDAQERIAGGFNRFFAHWDIGIAPADVTPGAHRTIQASGWTTTYRVDPDDAGLPCLEFYATHRMTNDRRHRIWADGHVEGLDAIWDMMIYDPRVPGSEEESRARYTAHNQKVAKELKE